MDQINVIARSQEPWNKGKLVGQKATFQAQGDLGDPREVGVICVSKSSHPVRPWGKSCSARRRP
jgi:hypothetical protein